MTQNRKESCVIPMTDTPLPSSGSARDCIQSVHMETSLTPPETSEFWVNQAWGGK